MRIAFASLCLLLAASALQAQNGTIAGTAVDSERAEPLRRVALVLRPVGGSSSRPLAAQSNEDGKFLLRDVPPGRYLLSASRSGYVDSSGGSGRPGRSARLLDLAEGQTIDDVVVRLTPGGVVTGRVIDDFGDPLPGVPVEALRYAYTRDKRELVPHGQAQTDDRGEFRLWGLPPGRYYIRAHSEDGRMMGDAPAPDVSESLIPTFFPSAAEAEQASQVEVRAGAETPGVDIHMLLDRTFRVSGVVIDGETRRPAGPLAVMLAPATGMGRIGPGMRDMVRDSSGKFTIAGVRPGSFRVQAFAMSGGRDRKTGSAEVVVTNRDISGLVVELHPATEISGKVEIEGGAPRPEGQLFVGLRSDRPGPLGGGGGMVDSEGKVTVNNASPGEYTVSINGELGDYFLKGVRFGDQLSADGEIEVAPGEQPELELLLSPNGGRIAGLVTSDKDEAISGATVALVREDRDERYTKVAQTDQNGAYLIRGIAPGRYQLFAWEEIEPPAWRDPDFLRSFEEDAEDVEVSESDALEVSLEALDQQER